MSDNIIYDLLKEVRDEQKKILEKQAEHKEETAKWQSNTSERLYNIEVDLREHKEGVIQNRGVLQEQKELINTQQERIKKLEEPGKVKAFIYDHGMKVFKFIAAAGAAGAIIGGWLNWF